MKQILIISCTLLLILGLHFVQYSFLKDSSKLLISKISKLEESITNDESLDKIQENKQELEKLWNKKELGYGIFCEHSAVSDIKESMSSIYKYISLLNEEETVKPHLLIECNVLKERINKVVESERLKLTNVL